MDRYKLVNPLMGSLNHMGYSNGNCYPVVAVPHGMNFFTIQTRGAADNASEKNWFFSPLDNFFEGIRLTHMPSPWLGDYCNLLIYGESGEVSTNECYRSPYNLKDAIIEPSYMHLFAECGSYSVELTPTNSCAVMRFNFDNKDSVNRIVFSGDRLSYEERDGYLYIKNANVKCKKFSQDDPRLIKEHVLIRADVTFSVSAGNRKVFIETPASEFSVYIATSFISFEQALLNFEREIGDKNFDEVRRKTESEWTSRLGVITLISEDEEKKKVFYSCFYRALLWPRRLYEIDSAGNAVHVNTATGNVCAGVLYTDNGFWDTYRTLYPFYSLVDPDEYASFAEGFYNYYVDTGWLPKWVCPYNVNCMPGMLIEATMADAIVKDIITGDLAHSVFEAMLKDGEYVSEINGEGRVGLKEYRQYGYVPYTVAKESVNETLDNAFGDFAIAMAAKKLGYNDIYERYVEYSKNYRNLFDETCGFMRGKDENGAFRNEDFDPYAWGRDYTEGSAWQNSFGVYHDINGLNELYNGKLTEKIDELMRTPPIYHVGSYGKVIHEMLEMVAGNYGQCAISNQPSFHIPFIYSELGDVERTAYHVERLSKLYSSGIEGYPGDEDNGSASAWYLLAALGLYQMAPSRPDFTVSLPLFDLISIKLRNGNTLNIERDKYDFKKIAAKIGYSDIMRGGNLADMLKDIKERDNG